MSGARELDSWPGVRMQFSAVLSAPPAPLLPSIVDELRAIPQVREVLVWSNDPEPRPLPGIALVRAPPELAPPPAHALAALAHHDNVLALDDAPVRPHEFAALLAEYVQDPSRLYGLRGRNLRDGRCEEADAFGEVDVVFGRCVMFHRGLLAAAFAAAGEVPRVSRDCAAVAFSLACRRKHRAVKVAAPRSEAKEPALPRAEAARWREAVDGMAAWVAAHPSEEVLRARAAEAEALLQAERLRADRLAADLRVLLGRHEQLARSLTVRTADRLKSLPFAYPAWLKAKALFGRGRS
jgi:hypothetical protein